MNHLKIIHSIWYKEELLEEWKESIIVPIYKKDIVLLSPKYKILPNSLLSRLTPFAEEIIGCHQCAFPSNRSSIDHIF